MLLLVAGYAVASSVSGWALPYVWMMAGVGGLVAIVGFTAGLVGLLRQRPLGVKRGWQPWVGLITPVPWLILIGWVALAFWLLSQSRGPIWVT